MAMEEGRGRREAWDPTAGGTRRRGGGGGQVWQEDRRAKEGGGGGGGGGGGWDDGARKGCQSALWAPISELHSCDDFFPDPNCDCCNQNPHTGSRAWGIQNLQNYIIKAK